MRRRSTDNRQRIPWTVLCLFICLMTSLANSSMFGGPTLVEAVHEVDLIVVGTIVSERESVPREGFFGPYPTKLGRVKVDEVLKGRLPEGPLEIESAIKPPMIAMRSRKVGDSGVWLLRRRTNPDGYHADFGWQLLSRDQRTRIIQALDISSGPVTMGLQLQACPLSETSSPPYVRLFAAIKNVSSTDISVPCGPGHLQAEIRRSDGASFVVGVEGPAGDVLVIPSGELKSLRRGGLVLPRTPFRQPGLYKVRLRYSDLGAGRFPPGQTLKGAWVDLLVSEADRD